MTTTGGVQVPQRGRGGGDRARAAAQDGVCAGGESPRSHGASTSSQGPLHPVRQERRCPRERRVERGAGRRDEARRPGGREVGRVAPPDSRPRGRARRRAPGPGGPARRRDGRTPPRGSPARRDRRHRRRPSTRGASAAYSAAPAGPGEGDDPGRLAAVIGEELAGQGRMPSHPVRGEQRTAQGPRARDRRPSLGRRARTPIRRRAGRRPGTLGRRSSPCRPRGGSPTDRPGRPGPASPRRRTRCTPASASPPRPARRRSRRPGRRPDRDARTTPRGRVGRRPRPPAAARMGGAGVMSIAPRLVGGRVRRPRLAPVRRSAIRPARRRPAPPSPPPSTPISSRLAGPTSIRSSSRRAQRPSANASARCATTARIAPASSAPPSIAAR